MGISSVPSVQKISDGKFWTHTFEKFICKTLVPDGGHPLSDLINFGFMAPYLLVFEEYNRSMDEEIAYAKENGLWEIAKNASSGVVFIFPTSENGWEGADETLFIDLIAESRIQQYYEDGFVKSRDRFTKQWGDRFIRGAIFRSFLFGSGKSADYIAKHLLKTINGLYLWGPGEITPTAVVLEHLSVLPEIERADIPVVSVENTEEIDGYIQNTCDHKLIQKTRDLKKAYSDFLAPFKRWCGTLEKEVSADELGLVEEFEEALVKTSPDNMGDDRGSDTHRIGYAVYYNKDLFKNGPAPLVLAFHGGGDSTFYLTRVSGWYRVAARNNFLLVAVENHLNSTATEMIELISVLRKKYPIDEKRIYASGFSMGGCKSWDLFQEYPSVFAALAPMSATFEVGLNVYGQKAPKEINRSVPVPVFYAGGEITPLPELPFQADKCLERMKYVFKVNRVKAPLDIEFADKDSWKNPIFGIDGDKVEKIHDPSRNAVLTVHYFESEDGILRTAFASIDNQGHECREHTCEQAWKFMSQFSR